MKSPAADWSVKRRLEYIEWAKAALTGLRGISPGLERQFDEAAAAAERSLNPPMAGAQVARSLAWWMSAIGATSENIHSMRVIPGGPKADMGCASQQPRMIGAAEAGAVGDGLAERVDRGKSLTRRQPDDLFSSIEFLRVVLLFCALARASVQVWAGNFRRATRAGRNPKAEVMQFDDRGDHAQPQTQAFGVSTFV